MLLLLNLYTSHGYYNSISDVIVNGVNQLKELLVFQIFGHVDLKTFGVHLLHQYLLYLMTLKEKGCCQQDIVIAKSAGTYEI